MIKTRSTFRWVVLISLVLFWTAGCGLLVLGDQESAEEKIQRGVAETMTAIHAAETLKAREGVPVPAQEMVTEEILTETVTATPTLTPTITKTPTMTITLEVPVVSVSLNTSCRSGPDINYQIVGELMVGEQAEVVGRSQDRQYWVVKNPDGSGECWLWAEHATVMGPLDDLVLYTPPPPAVSNFDWGGTWDVVIAPVGGGGISILWTMTVDVSGKSFTGTIDYGSGSEIYTGTINDDGSIVSGTRSNNAESGLFKIFAYGANQFQGYQMDGAAEFEFCGSRGTVPLPSPCYKK